MIWCLTITTIENKKLKFYGDNKKERELLISEYYSSAKSITLNTYKLDETEIIK
jgi:hypothetical protein